LKDKHLRPVRKSNTPLTFCFNQAPPYPLLAKIDLTFAYPPCLAPPHSTKQTLNPCLACLLGTTQDLTPSTYPLLVCLAP